MSTKPILFNTEMVRAILDDKKTVTRRLVKSQPDSEHTFPLGWVIEGFKQALEGYFGWGTNESGGSVHYQKPPCKIGDILYVRETFADTWTPSEDTGYVYKADGEPRSFPYWGNASSCNSDVWRPSLHMPKEAARIFLKVTEVRVERLQDMDGQDVLKEGVNSLVHPQADYFNGNQRDMFERLWDSTVDKSKIDLLGWNANPWVWVIDFERVSKEDMEKVN